MHLRRLSFRIGVFLTAFAALAPPSIGGEENSYTLGLDSRCLYGLVPCWPEVREPLTKVPGVKSVSASVDPLAWTCEVKTVNGGPPDANAILQTLRAGVGEQFSLRGIEANVSGRLQKVGGRFVVRLQGSGAVLRLGPLTRKVQWDPHQKKDFAITNAERGAWETLTRQWRGKSRAIQLTGPLRAGTPGEQVSTLEVRAFALK